MSKAQFFLPRKKARQKQTLNTVERANTYHLWYLRRTSNHSNDKLAIDNQGDCELWGDTLLFCYNTVVKTHDPSFFSRINERKESQPLGGRGFGGIYGRNKKDSNL